MDKQDRNAILYIVLAVTVIVSIAIAATQDCPKPKEVEMGVKTLYFKGCEYLMYHKDEYVEIKHLENCSNPKHKNKPNLKEAPTSTLFIITGDKLAGRL